MEIPKIIHQIWIGPKNPPKWCMDSWRIDYIKHNPKWTYKLWTEKEINKLQIVNRHIYNTEPTLRGKADIIRYEILYQYGGIYIDADSLYLDNQLDQLIESTNNTYFFAGREPRNKQFVANGVIGCSPNNKIIYTMIDYLSKNYFDLKHKYPHKYQIWQVTNQPKFTEICEKNRITIFPSYYFYPEGFIKNNITIPLETIKNKYKNSFMYQYWLSHYE